MNITIISSSTRTGRISHRIARALSDTLEKMNARVTIIDLLELGLPPFTERLPYLDNPDTRLHETMDQLVESDGLIFLTPEYNGAPSSGLKNFIDVFAKKGFSGKPIGVATGSTGSMGGIRAAYIVQQMILSIHGYPQPLMLTVGKMDQVLNEDGSFADERTKERFEKFAETYLSWVSKLSA